MVELFQIGVPGDWVVDLDQAGLAVKVRTRSILLGSNSMLGGPDQKSLGGMIAMQIRIGRNHVKGYGIEIVMREPANVPMTRSMIAIQEKRGTTIEIVRGLGTRTEKGTGRETVGVTGVTEIGTGIMVGTMIERGNVSALMTAIMTGAGIVTEITRVQVMNGTVVACTRGMLIMAMVRLDMTETWLIMSRITSITSMNNTKAMRHTVMVKMDMGMKLSAQSEVSVSIIVVIHTVRWQPTIRRDLTMQNLKPLRKVRHTRKATTNITEPMNTGTET